MTKEELKQEAEGKSVEYADNVKSVSIYSDVLHYSWEQITNAYEQGALDFAEPREKQIEILSKHILELQADKGRLTDKVRELEAEVKEWKDKADLWCKTANLKDHNIMINKELEKHNEELIALINAERKRQEQCDDIHLRKIADLEKENAELKAENQKWKDEWQEQAQKATDEGYARTLQTMQLTKAKEIIKELLNSCFGYNSKTVNYEVKAKAEQFLKNNA